MVKDLSSGQRQRLFIVLALTPPAPRSCSWTDCRRVWMRRRAADVWIILEDLKQQGLTILPTSHYMDEIETLCDEIWRLRLSGT